MGGGVVEQRYNRLTQTMGAMQIPYLLTADPINIAYATGVRNMSVFSMMGATRFALVSTSSDAVAFEFSGAEHLAAASPIVGDVRSAPGVTALAGHGYQRAAEAFARDVAELCGASPKSPVTLAVERMDHPITDALRDAGFHLRSATDVFVESRRLKQPAELAVMREAMTRVEAGVQHMLDHLRPGVTEIEVWSHFHQHLIATDGEYTSTRLVQAGERTFPYFQEAGDNEVRPGDLFCIDTDAIGLGGYAVDFSRTYHVGPDRPTQAQRELHALAHEQLLHNAALLEPGRTFEAFANGAWPMPDRYSPYRYSCLAHGLGMSGEFPYVPEAVATSPYPLEGAFEPNMVICVESYIGDPGTSQGVKLENQYLITDAGVECMSVSPIDLILNR